VAFSQYIREGAQAKKSYEDKFGAKVSRLQITYHTSQRRPEIPCVRVARFPRWSNCVTLDSRLFCLACTDQHGVKAGANAPTQAWEEEAPAEGADSKAVADAKEVSRGGAAAAKVRAHVCSAQLS
jgi:hypothetical protein